MTFIEIRSGLVEAVDKSNIASSLKGVLLGNSDLFGQPVVLLKDINLVCNKSEVIAFIGGNGSGKSTLLKVIAGIYPLKSGLRRICGTITSIIELTAGMDMEFTGRENIKLLMVYNGMLYKYSKSLETCIIQFAELENTIDRKIKYYSSGMISRLAFATCILQQANILLLDEVFAVGDAKFINKATQALYDKFYHTQIVILVSHDENIIRKYCTRCILLKDGRIIMDDMPNKVLEIYNKNQ